MNKDAATEIKRIAKDTGAKIQSVNYNAKSGRLSIRVATYTDNADEDNKRDIINRGNDRASAIIKSVEEKTGAVGRIFNRRYSGFINDICVIFE